MHFIDFPGTNITLTPPKGMTDEECQTIKAYKGENFFLCAFMPNKEDIEAILAGKPIFYQVMGQSLRQMCLYTMNDDNKINQ